MRLQMQRRDPLRVAQHPLWQEVESRLKERLAPIRVDESARMNHGIAEFGRAMNPSPGSLSMIWSVGLLAYLSNPTTTFGFWRQALKPGGLLMFATLGPDSFRALALALGDPAQSVHVAGYPDMHDLGDALIHSRFADPVMDAEWVTLSYATAESALKDLRLLGGNALMGRPSGLRGRAWRERVLKAFEALQHDEKLHLQVEMVFGHAWRAEEKPANPRQERTKDQIQPIRWSGRAPEKP